MELVLVEAEVVLPCWYNNVGKGLTILTRGAMRLNISTSRGTIILAERVFEANF